jgi:hypothetical protein
LFLRNEIIAGPKRSVITSAVRAPITILVVKYKNALNPVLY